MNIINIVNSLLMIQGILCTTKIKVLILVLRVQNYSPMHRKCASKTTVSLTQQEIVMIRT